MNVGIQKPPIGVIPTRIWLQRRCCDLARAIYEYTHAEGVGASDRARLVQEWSRELNQHLTTLALKDYGL